MVKLVKLAKVIRSKNSGPYELTFDIIFRTKQIYERIKKKKPFNPSFVKKTFHIGAKDILDICYFDAAKAVKITIARHIASGDIMDTDVYGAQQHAPLVNAKINY